MDHIVENLIGSLLDAQHDYAEESIDSLKNDGKEVYIFGAGAAGKLIKQDLDRFEIPVYRFVDNDVKNAICRSQLGILSRLIFSTIEIINDHSKYCQV